MATLRRTKKESEGRAPATVYLLEGNEPVLRREFLEQLRARLQVTPQSMDEAVVDARETPVATLANLVQTIPMEGDYRLVIVHWVNRYSPTELQALANLVSQVPPFACLVLLPAAQDDEKSEARSAWSQLVSAVKSHGQVVEHKALKGKAVSDRLMEEASAQGKHLRPEDADYLQQLVDGHAERALNELQKLIFYVHPRIEIRRADIEAVVSPTQEARVFNMIDAILAGDAPQAMSQFRLLFQAGSNPQEVALKTLGLLARQYRLLWGVYLLLEHQVRLDHLKAVPPEIAQKLPKEPNVLQFLERQPYLRGKVIQQARNLRFDSLCRALEAIQETDLALKGLAPGVNPTESMERLVVKLLTLSSGRTRN